MAAAIFVGGRIARNRGKFAMTGSLIFIGSAALAWALGFPVHRMLLKARVIDLPNARSSHVAPVARGGGIAIFGATIVVVALATAGQTDHLIWWLMGAAGLLAAVSFVDDVKSLPRSWRFLSHSVAAAIALVAFSGPSGQFVAEGRTLLVYGAAFVWVVGYTNAYNFMDGINGLAAGQAVVTGLGFAIVAAFGAAPAWDSPPFVLSLALAGAAAGFLPHNAVRARMFMGDVGSTPLGFLFASLTLWFGLQYGVALGTALMLIHANFLLDTAFTLLRRVLRGERWLQPHREHFYQRLVRSGWSHQRVTGTEIGLQVWVIAVLLIYLRASAPFKIALGGMIIATWLAFFAWAEYQFTRSSRQ